MTADLADAIVTVLATRGPIDELQLARILLRADADLSGDRLQAGLRAAGAIRVDGPRGPLVALPAPGAGPPPTAAPARGVAPDERLRAVVGRTPRRALLVLAVAALLVVLVLAVSLHAARAGAPTTRYPDAAVSAGG